jgi:hypothetical protein
MALAPFLILAPLFLFFLPGALFLRLVSARRRGPLPRDFREWLFISVLASVLAASWIGLVLAELSAFSMRAVVAALAVLSLALILAARGNAWGIPHAGGKGLAWAGLFALLAAALYSPPYEYALGNWDPGTYVNTGARLARHGSIAYRDPVLGALPPGDRSLFYFTHLIPQRYEGGMAIGDHDRAIVSPHFYHLYTVWIALFHALGGLRLSLWVNPALGLLALAAFALAVRELAGGRGASLAALFLACSAAEIWCVRFPTAEIAAQLCFWSGLFCLFRALDEDRAGWALLAGVCFAEALLAIFTAALVLPALLIALFFFKSRRTAAAFLVPLLLGIAHLFIQDMTVCRPYFERQAEVLRSFGLTPLRLAAAGGGFLAFLGALRAVWGRASRLAVSRLFRWALIAALVALSLYAYHFRPHLSGGADARNLRELGWFVYPLSLESWYFPAGLLLALAGMILFIRGGLDGKRGVFFMVAVPVCAFFVTRKLIFPSYLWAVRRYIPLAFPALVFFMTYPLARLAGRGKGGRVAAAGAALVLIACMQFGYTRRVVPTDYAGTVEFLARLAAPLDKGGIYVCEGSGMAAPLDCVYGIEILQLSGQTPEKCRAVEGVMGRWLEAGRRVYYISRGGWPISPALRFIPVQSAPLSTDHLEYRVGAFPKNRIPIEITARVFRVEPLGDSPEGGASRRVIEIGEDAFPLLRGFYGPVMRWEKEGGKPMRRWARWTAGDAALVIPTLGSRGDLAVTLRAAAPAMQRAGGGSVPVRVSAEGREIATVAVGSSMGDCRFTVPAAALQPGKTRLSLEIRSPVHRGPPQEFLEPRDLGICIDRVEIARAGRDS